MPCMPPLWMPCIGPCPLFGATRGTVRLLACAVISSTLNSHPSDERADMELGTFCNTYSGDSRTMQKSDWSTLKMHYYKNMNPKNEPLGLENVARIFFGAVVCVYIFPSVFFQVGSKSCNRLSGFHIAGCKNALGFRNITICRVCRACC